ncbi:MAG: VWA domain-containing protein [Gemmataceae bacterium]
MTFAHPWMLTLLAPAAVAIALMMRERFSHRQRRATLGDPHLIGRLLLHTEKRWPIFAAAFGLSIAAFAAAGPSWGDPEMIPVRRDRDVMLVLDVSRSMHAEQPSRLQQAKRALHLLADRWREYGKHRIGLVAVAGKAKLAFPLTSDLDHLRFLLDQIEPDALPWPLGADADDPLASGTRLGEGIRLAVESLDPARLAWQDVVLLSDGDDPAGDDEWMRGVKAATEAGVPVHVVAIGDAAEGHPIPHKGKLLAWRGEIVSTRRNDAVLNDIARLTGGTLFPGTVPGVPLGRLLEDVWAERPVPPDTYSSLAGPPNRACWLLVPAILSLALWAIGRHNSNFAFRLRLPLRPVVASLVLFGVAAGSDDSTVSMMRRAHALYQVGDYAAALALYERAESVSLDPGNAAYHQAACTYKLGRFADAAERCLRVLDDAEASKDRKARAWFLRGNALVAASRTRRSLEQAMEAYRECLVLADGNLHHDARRNLDLAAALWTQAAPEASSEQPMPNVPDPSSKKKVEAKDVSENQVDAKPSGAEGKKSEGHEPTSDDPNMKRVPGSLQVLPEQDQLVPLSVEDADKHLDRLLQRIAQERRTHRIAVDRVDPKRKDW